jgi:hypothetical protein
MKVRGEVGGGAGGKRLVMTGVRISRGWWWERSVDDGSGQELLIAGPAAYAYAHAHILAAPRLLITCLSRADRWMGPAVIDELWWDLMGWHQVRAASSPTLLPQLDQLRRPHQHATATIRPRRLLSGLTKAAV